MLYHMEWDTSQSDELVLQPMAPSSALELAMVASSRFFFQLNDGEQL